MSSLSEFKQFVERQQTKTDTYWRSILQSDTRNIFPKYQLSKIEISKNRVAKLRLIMEHLSQFLSLQVYAKNIENIAKITPEKEFQKELNQIRSKIELCKQQPNSSDYAFQILQSKDKIQLLCTELSKQKIKPQTRQLLEKNEKWKNYVEQNSKLAQPYDYLLNQRNKADLAFNINLNHVEDCLINNTSGKIIEERVKQEVMKHRLRQILQDESLTNSFNQQNDPWRRQWEQTLQKLNNASI